MTIPLLSKQILDKFPFENVCVRYVKTVLIDFILRKINRLKVKTPLPKALNQLHAALPSQF